MPEQTQTLTPAEIKAQAAAATAALKAKTLAEKAEKASAAAAEKAVKAAAAVSEKAAKAERLAAEKTEKEAKAKIEADAAAAAAAEVAMAEGAAKLQAEATAKLKKEADAAAAIQAKAQKASAKSEASAKKQADKEAAVATKLANKMPEQNGITRPRPTGKCGRAWALMDAMSKELGAPVAIADLLVRSNAAGLNPSMTRSNYAVWRKFNSVTGRVIPVAKQAAVLAAAQAVLADATAKVEAARLAELSRVPNQVAAV